jgi:hypothetical protein
MKAYCDTSVSKHIFSAAAIIGLALAACSDDESDPNGAGGNAPGVGGSAVAGSSGSGGSGGAAAGSGGASGSGMGGTGIGGSGMGGTGGGESPDAGGGAEALSFFVSSEGVGAEGGNFGGLDGADALCDRLATAVGAGDRTWRAFLSTNEIDARSRIGDGPWRGADGALIAESLTALFTTGIPQAGRNLLDENGDTLANNIHDIVTGSDQDGTGLDDLNCNAWTSNQATDQTIVGHSNGMGPQGANSAFGWIRAHTGNTNCNQAGLQQGGGDGRIYCFAAD